MNPRPSAPGRFSTDRPRPLDELLRLSVYARGLRLVGVSARRLLLRIICRGAFVAALCLTTIFCAASARADFSVQLDAGRLRVNAGSALPHVDATAPSKNGSLLLLIAANGDGTFSSDVPAGHFVGGNDQILGAAGFNNNGGTDETQNFIYVATAAAPAPGDRVALRWFPDITYQQYLDGVTPTAGQAFGTYNPRVSNAANTADNPDGGDPWVIPPNGLINLDFYTSDSDGGGSQSPGEGYASSAVLSPTPPPTPTPSVTPTPSATPIASATPSPSASATPTPSATASSTPSPGATPTPSATAPTDARLANISTRLEVGIENDAPIAGFIIGGESGSTKKVLIRAMGPSLADYGVAGALLNPLLTLHRPDGTTESNDDWRVGPYTSEIPSKFQPSDDRESVIVASLPPGRYSAVVEGVDRSTGVGLAEVYDLDAASPAALDNLSTRGLAGQDAERMIGGFIVTGTSDTKAVIRAIGPSLRPYGVMNALADPSIEVFDADGVSVAANDDWQDTQKTEIQNEGLAPSDPKESAVLVHLKAGQYTAIVKGADGGTGVGLVEFYRLSSP